MQAKEILKKAVVYLLDNGDDTPMDLMAEHILYWYIDDLDENVPLEEFEAAIIEDYGGNVPESIDRWLSSLAGESETGNLAELIGF